MSKIICKICEYFEDVKGRQIPSPTKENVFNKVEVFYGVCNNIQVEEYRHPCWEHYYCKNGKEKEIGVGNEDSVRL